MTIREHSAVRFHKFEFDPNSGVLRKSGVRIRLSRRSVLLLDRLLSGRGDAVERQELANVLWGDEIHVDFDDGLNHAVKRLRDALGDDPKSPRYIERVPGVGYRFIADVKSPAGPRPAQSSRRGRWLPATALAVCTAAVAAWMAWPTLRAVPIGPTVAPSNPMVVVLPFTNLSADQDAELYASQVADELTDELAKIAGLRVASRTSATHLHDLALSPEEIGDRLGASHLVTGSVVPSGESFRVTARLKDGASGLQVWSMSFDVQKDAPLPAAAGGAPREIAAAVRVRVTPDEEVRLASARPVRLDVYEKYSRGRDAFESGDLDTAVQMFEETVEMDPDYAPAYSWLADAHVSLGYWAVEPAPSLARARTAALRAMQLDPTLAEPHLLRARVLAYFEWKWAEAEEHFLKALESNPSHVRTYLVYAQYLALLHRRREAEETVERALELDPLGASTNGLAGEVYHSIRNYPRAIELLQTAVGLHPDGVQYHVQLACIFGAAGEYDKAHRHIDRVVEGDSDDVRAQAIQAWIYALSDRKDAARRLVKQIEPTWSAGHSSHYTRAFVYNALGESERAFRVLEESVDVRWPFLATAMSLPPYDPVRGDPRFVSILDRMGLSAVREANARPSPDDGA